MAVLERMERVRESEFVFPGTQRAVLSDMSMLAILKRMGRDDLTVHGFRSSFRDWGAERTNFPNEMLEMALAHAVSDKVEAAYRRGDMFDKRRKLMDAWAKLLHQASGAHRRGRAVARRAGGVKEQQSTLPRALSCELRARRHLLELD